MRFVKRYFMFATVPLLAIGLICCGHRLGSGYVRDLCLSTASGLLVYFGTVQCCGLVRRIRVKRLLQQQYKVFKKRMIETLLDLAEVNIFPRSELSEKLMDPKEFRVFFGTKCDGHDRLDVVRDRLTDCPNRFIDLQVDIKLYFDKVISLVPLGEFRIRTINKLFHYAECYNRLRDKKLQNHDAEHLVNSLYSWFSDDSLVDRRPCEFSREIDEI